MEPFIQRLGVLSAMLCVFLSASAYDFKADGIYYKITDPAAKEVEVTYESESYGSYSGDIVVPSSVTYKSEDYKVTAIGDEAFLDCISLTSIEIPKTVTTIGDGTFSDCIGLTTITIPNSVTTIGDYTFSGCSELTTIILPNSVTTIGDYAFDGCDGLTTIAIPNSVTTIGEGTFSWCGGLTSITIPGSVTAIGDWTFSNCSRLTNIEVAGDNQVYSSKDGVLYNKSQTAIVCCPEGKTGDFIIPNTVTTIGKNAFARSRLTNIGVADDNEAYMSKDGIVYNKSQTTIVCCPGGKAGEIIIPNSVTTIGEGSFSNCIDLTSIVIPNTVTTIGEGSFFGCRGLTSIVIPGSVTTIGDKTFLGCEALRSITSLAVTPPGCGDRVFERINIQMATLYVPAGSLEAYKQAPVWKEFKLVAETGAGIGSIEAGDAAAATEVYNLAGVKVAATPENLPAGIYIVREGLTARKIVVR